MPRRTCIIIATPSRAPSRFGGIHDQSSKEAVHKTDKRTEKHGTEFSNRTRNSPDEHHRFHRE